MATIERFEDLDVWKRARELSNLIYDFSNSSLLFKDYALRDQMRRAAISIMSNIAEGFESQTQAQFIQLLSRAKGSSGELRAQLYLALDQKYLTEEKFNKAILESETCSKQLSQFIQYLVSKPNTRRVRDGGAFYDVE